MKQTAFVSHYDCSRHDTGWGHPDHQGRLPALMRAVYRDMLTLFDPLLEVEGRHATEDELRLVHQAEHLDRVRQWVDAAAERGEVIEPVEMLRISAATWDAAAAAAGCGIAAVDAVLEGRVRNAFAAVRPEGRDASPNAPGRFGLFNNVAVAARYLRTRSEVDSVLVVECGGTGPSEISRILSGDRDVELIGAHRGSPQAGAVPGRRWTGSASELDLAGAMADLLATVDISPDGLVLVAMDFGGGPGGAATVLEPSICYTLTNVLREFADRRCGGRLVSIMEGGYDPSELGAAVVQHLRGLAGLEAA